jgi:hypothetical protein
VAPFRTTSLQSINDVARKQAETAATVSMAAGYPMVIGRNVVRALALGTTAIRIVRAAMGWVGMRQELALSHKTNKIHRTDW